MPLWSEMRVLCLCQCRQQGVVGRTASDPRSGKATREGPGPCWSGPSVHQVSDDSSQRAHFCRVPSLQPGLAALFFGCPALIPGLSFSLIQAVP